MKLVGKLYQHGNIPSQMWLGALVSQTMESGRAVISNIHYMPTKSMLKFGKKETQRNYGGYKRGEALAELPCRPKCGE